MALLRLALKNFQNRVVVAPPSSSAYILVGQKQRWASQLLRRISSKAEEKPDADTEVEVTDGGKKSKLFSKRKNRRGIWRRNDHHFVPALSEFFHSGLGHALMQATENMNKLMHNLSPFHLMGRAREHDDCYKLQYHMPGLTKEDIKLTMKNGILSIRGEKEEEEEGTDDDEFWPYKSYGLYNASILLPDDAKVDEIKAEVKDGVLNIFVPKTERSNKDVKEIKVE